MLIDLGPALRRIVVSLLPLAPFGCTNPWECDLSHLDMRLDKVYDVEAQPPGDGSAADLVRMLELCMADATSCDALCRALVAQDGQGRVVRMDTCQLVPGAGEHQDVHVAAVSNSAECGRRPAGLREAPRSPGCADPVGVHLARAAWLEAASVPAFHTLARELTSHGAPRSLIAAARRAARDEVRHTVVTRALARRYGAGVAPAEVDPSPVRPLEEMAAENASEGCVRETFGALVAEWQGRTAGDQAIRLAMARIARDEARHASLAWSVDRWVTSRLGARPARRRMERAREDALATLAAEASSDVHSDLVRAAGLPAPDIAARLLAAVAVL